MNITTTRRARLFLAILGCLGAAQVQAHSGGATMDEAGNKASFTALARVTCFDDGAGPAQFLVARVRDKSPAVTGLYVSLQLLKGTRATSVTDLTPGDAEYSEFATLAGGNGTYQLIINKTKAGAREFDLEWHCLTASNDHTGTEVIVDQFE